MKTKNENTPGAWAMVPVGIYSLGLSHELERYFAVLLSHCRPTDGKLTCYPGRDTLERELGLKPSKRHKVIDRLKDEAVATGYLETRSRRSTKGNVGIEYDLTKLWAAACAATVASEDQEFAQPAPVETKAAPKRAEEEEQPDLADFRPIDPTRRVVLNPATRELRELGAAEPVPEGFLTAAQLRETTPAAPAPPMDKFLGLFKTDPEREERCRREAQEREERVERERQRHIEQARQSLASESAGPVVRDWFSEVKLKPWPSTFGQSWTEDDSDSGPN
jgi:hypothetical protein